MQLTRQTASAVSVISAKSLQSFCSTYITKPTVTSTKASTTAYKTSTVFTTQTAYTTVTYVGSTVTSVVPPTNAQKRSFEEPILARRAQHRAIAQKRATTPSALASFPAATISAACSSVIHPQTVTSVKEAGTTTIPVTSTKTTTVVSRT